MQSTKDLFNSKAPAWDKKESVDPRRIEAMLTLADIRPGARILDVGCGTGFLEPYLLDCGPHKILAVDFAENMISIAKQKLQDTRVEFACADIFDVHADDLYDDCFLYNAFPYFEDPERLVTHINSLLKPGGRLVISHQQGKTRRNDSFMVPPLPAQGLINILRSTYRLDVLVDSDAMLMVSGTLLGRKESQAT